MAFGYGPGSEMGKSQKGNRSLVKGRTTLKETSKIYKYKGLKETRELYQPSKQELEELRKDLKTTARKKHLILYGTVLISITLASILLFVLLSA